MAGLFSIALPSYSADEPYTSESKAAKPGRAISEDVKTGNKNQARSCDRDVKTGNMNNKTQGRAIETSRPAT